MKELMQQRRMEVIAAQLREMRSQIPCSPDCKHK